MVFEKREILWSSLQAHNFPLADKMLDQGMDIDVSIIYLPTYKLLNGMLYRLEMIMGKLLLLTFLRWNLM